MRCKRTYHFADGKELVLGGRTLIMGILNVTPDSFSDGGQWNTLAKAKEHVKQMVAEGADLIDIGAESTRPGSTPLTAEEEQARLLPYLRAIVPESPVPISVDTYHAATARAAAACGVHILNDVWGLQYAGEPRGAMAQVAAETELPIHRAVSYSDLALRRFFESASKEPWYNNTLFVLTGDHTNASAVPEYRTASGLFSVPIVFFTPDGSLPKGVREGLAMQMDVKPTVLSYLGYDKPYLSFGCDLLTTPEDETYAFHAHGTRYCYYTKGWQLQFDGEKSIGLYAFEKDHLLEENLLESHPEIAAPMEARLKAVIQQYNYRMIHNEMTAEPAAN